MVHIELNRIVFAHKGNDHEPLFLDFTLEIAAGQWVVLVGPSGAGKTTLLKLIKGLFQAQAGEIKINGAPVHPGELNHQIACVFSDPENQIVSPIVAEDVAFALENAGLAPETIRVRVEKSLRWVGLWGKSRDYSHHLSGGEQQRLILAGALAMGKGCLLLDDPLCMLGGASRIEILKLLDKIHRYGSVTVVQTTHILEEALFAQRLVAIDRGKLVFDGSPPGFLREKELIEHLGLEIPAVAELCQTLADRGLGETGNIFTAEQLLGLLTGGQKGRSQARGVAVEDERG